MAGPRWTPVFKNTFEPAFGDMGQRLILRHVSDAKSGECCVEHLPGTVEDELAFDAHLQFARAFFEFPRVQAAMREQTQIDAVMIDQVLWLLRLRPFFEI